MTLRTAISQALDRFADALEGRPRSIAVTATDGWVNLRDLPEAWRAQLDVGPGKVRTLYIHRAQDGALAIRAKP